jgi:hypothetical protein
MLFIQSLSTDLGRAFWNERSFEIGISGEISRGEQIQFVKPFEYVFTCGTSSNVDELCTVERISGFDNSVEFSEMSGSLNGFTDAGIYQDDNVPWRVYTSNDFDVLSGLVALPQVPLVEGVTHIEYRYELAEESLVQTGCWLASPSGSVIPVEYPPGTGNQMTELTAGPVTLECDLAVTEKPAEIRYDSGFLGTDGTLTVSLGGVEVETHLAGEGIPGDVSLRRIAPSDDQWAAASGSTLAFGLTGPDGAKALLDNVVVLPAPEPGTHPSSIASLVTLLLIARRRGRLLQ